MHIFTWLYVTDLWFPVDVNDEALTISAYSYILRYMYTHVYLLCFRFYTANVTTTYTVRWGEKETQRSGAVSSYSRPELNWEEHK